MIPQVRRFPVGGQRLTAGFFSVALVSTLLVPSVTSAEATQNDDGDGSYEWVHISPEESEEILSGPNAPELTPIDEFLDAEDPVDEGSQRNSDYPASVPDEEVEDLRDDCQRESEAATASGWFRDRFSQCVIKEHHVVLREMDGPGELGHLHFDTVLLGFAVNGSREVEYVSSVENIEVDLTGPDDPRFWEIEQTFYPANSSDEVVVPPTRERSDVLNEWDLYPEWELGYSSPDDGHLHEEDDFQIVNARVSMSLGVSSPSADASWSEIGTAVSNVRFDHAGPVVGRHQGTVFQDAEITFELSTEDPSVQETALHIYDAQNRPWMTFPSWVGKSTPGEDEAIHRTLDTTVRDENRAQVRRTCRDVWGDYDGALLNCDEYPFASTYEGAASGDDRYSARLIDADDNQEAGRRLGQFYRENRVLDGDAFYVHIVG